MRHRTKIGSILSYSLCSGFLLLVNKVAMVAFPAAGFISLIQLVFGSAALVIFSYGRCISLDALTKPVLRAYFIYSLLFVLALYSNMMALSSHNVDTIVAVRSLAPCVVSVLDFQFLGRTLPEKSSVGGLALVVVGTFLFSLDAGESEEGQSGGVIYLVIYLVVISVEMAFGKMVTRDHPVSLSTSVLLTNVMAIPGVSALTFMKGEFNDVGGMIDDCKGGCRMVLLLS